MSIITISKGNYLFGKEAAETLAKKLSYECISRENILNASGQFNPQEIKLSQNQEIPPSIFDRLFINKEKYRIYIRSAFLKCIKKDNTIYHGFAGHIFVQDIPNICKIMITVGMKHRIDNVMQLKKVSSKEAQKIIEKEDADRRKFGVKLYGVDINEPNLYDLVIRIDNMTLDNVIDIILNTINKPCFQISSESIQTLNDLALEAEIRAQLYEKFPTSRHISCKKGNATVLIEGTVRFKEKASPEIKEILDKIEDLKNYELLFKH